MNYVWCPRNLSARVTYGVPGTLETQFPASVPMNYVWCPRNLLVPGTSCPRNLSTKVYQLGFNRTLGLTQKDIASFVGCSQSLISLRF